MLTKMIEIICNTREFAIFQPLNTKTKATCATVEPRMYVTYEDILDHRAVNNMLKIIEH
jgi:hypothetical protein